MNPQEAHDLIRAACLRRPELAYSGTKRLLDIEKKRVAMRETWKKHPYKGMCYVASHVFSYLTGAEIWATDDGMHYWNILDGKVWDLTKEQFDYEFDYSNAINVYAHRVPRKNKLTARAKELYNELGI